VIILIVSETAFVITSGTVSEMAAVVVVIVIVSEKVLLLCVTAENTATVSVMEVVRRAGGTGVRRLCGETCVSSATNQAILLEIVQRLLATNLKAVLDAVMRDILLRIVTYA